MNISGEVIGIGTVIFLFLALALALGFEFVNGFHDTANAVATVIYTHTLKPTYAVVWSGCWNLIGVLTSTGAVAFGIVALLPVELVINIGTASGFAMVFALLISAMMWNIGTWYLGLPASSSHTLIGSILGVGLANSLLSGSHHFGEGVNWGKAVEVFTSLLVSPIVGFVGAALLLLLCKTVIKRPELYESPQGEAPPPFWIRCLLMLTCTGVSFAHGSNDGQKGMGLLMLILIGILPGAYSLNLHSDAGALTHLAATSHTVSARFANLDPTHKATLPPLAGKAGRDELAHFLKEPGGATAQTAAALTGINQEITDRIAGRTTLSEISTAERSDLRTDIYLLSGSIGKLDKSHQFHEEAEKKDMAKYKKELDGFTNYIPIWVKVAVALSLGLGTMIGWKRIVVTVGEKIGKQHLTYAEGASAELVAMLTIGAADRYGLPVSTTHVLSSGVAGTMAANHSGLQIATLRNLLMAWVLTLPVCIFLGATLFAAGLYIVLHILHL